jgi:hypothetical protein
MRPQKALPLVNPRRLEISCVQIGSVVWSVGLGKEKKKGKVKGKVR